MAFFLKKINPEGRILDVGGTSFNWRICGYAGGQVVLLNLVKENMESMPSNFISVEGDATNLNYPDLSFDVVFSNSVIEHVGTFENQKKFATEAMRVGKKIFIQTPAKEFFFDPHTLTPFIHYLPKKLQRKLLRNFSIWGLIARPSQKYIDEYLSSIRFLSKNEISEIFQGCEILVEKFIFMTKSYIIIRK